MQILLYVVIGIGAGICSGIFGIGGGIVLVPTLVLGLRMSQQGASGTSLVALLAPVGVLGAFEYYRAGKIGPEQLKIGLWIALGIFLGAYLGAKVAVEVPDTVLRKVFAVFLVVVAAKMWFAR